MGCHGDDEVESQGRQEDGNDEGTIWIEMMMGPPSGTSRLT